MLKYKKTLYVEDAVIERYNRLMRPNPPIDYEKEDIDQYDNVRTWIVKFPDETEMDIKICSGAKSSGDALWTEGSLFQSGEELTFTYPKTQLDTEFTCEINQDDSRKHTMYTVIVLPESKRQK